MRSVQQVEDDDAFCRLIYRFTVNKMILKYQSGRKHGATKRHDEALKRKGEGGSGLANLNQMIFYDAKYGT